MRSFDEHTTFYPEDSDRNIFAGNNGLMLRSTRERHSQKRVFAIDRFTQADGVVIAPRCVVPHVASIA